ncbi:MAG: CRISPR-associated protein Csx20 [Desulfobacteraceae bacterium]
MSRSLFLIFSHIFTDSQREDAFASLGVDRIVDMPSDYKAIWSDIPPSNKKINNYLEPVKIWLNHEARDEDYVLIQGDFGACYIMVSYCFHFDLVPIYSTTNRRINETFLKSGAIKIIHHFKHNIFRKYERCFQTYM